MIQKIINFCKGIICVRLTGPRCELLINALHRNKIKFYKVRYIDESNILLNIYEKDFEYLQSLCKRYFIEIRTESMFSIKVFGRYYKKRWGTILGVLSGLVLLFVINCFIWDVSVIGCDKRTTEQEILRQFEELGFGVGSFRFGWNFTDLENKFMMVNKDVIWVSVNMRFTTVEIELQERSVKTEEIFDLSKPCDIFAARDGQIVSMMVTSGVPLVSEGDAVFAGEKLVSREYLDKYGNTIIVHSIATIQAKTKRVITVEQPLKKKIHIPTGKNKTFFTLSLFNFKIPLYFKENISYNSYDYTEQQHRFKLGKSFAFPLSIHQKKYTEVTVETQSVSKEQVKTFAFAQLERLEKEQLYETEILNRTVKEEMTEEKLVLTAEYDCLEDIALKVGE